MIQIWMLAFCTVFTPASARSFVIDYENNRFLKDGQPFRFISGSFHYQRTLRQYWPDRLKKIKSAGLNTVQFLTFWNYHERTPGSFHHKSDLIDFIDLIQLNQLLAIVRIGPYICSEWDNGGFPWWFATTEGLKVRRMNGPYLKEVQRWFGMLLPVLKTFLYTNGGPIIAIQVENEYGSIGVCDHEYMEFLVNLIRSHLGENVVLFTVDRADEKVLECGSTPGAFVTIDHDFTTNCSLIIDHFKLQAKFNPKGSPMVNPEFYPGNFIIWGQRFPRRKTEQVVKAFECSYKLGANLNFYMFHGGTNFGYWNGATRNDFEIIETTYDNDSPLTEAGDTTHKFFAIRETIAKLTGRQPPDVPQNTTKTDYGMVKMTRLGSIIDLLDIVKGEETRSQFPLRYGEILGAYKSAFVLYETEIISGGNLTISQIRDRAYVSIKNECVGLLSRKGPNSVFVDKGQGSSKLQILVENQARPDDRIEWKGIGNVTLDGEILANWNSTPICLSKTFSQLTPANPIKKNHQKSIDFRTKREVANFSPSIFHGTFPAPLISDTYFDPTGWGKGQLFINGDNIGRYWPKAGPQMTLYVPKYWLKHMNTVLIFELEQPGLCSTRDTCMVRFIDFPKLG